MAFNFIILTFMLFLVNSVKFILKTYNYLQFELELNWNQQISSKLRKQYLMKIFPHITITSRIN